MNYKCKYCEREFEKNSSRGQHHRFCLENPLHEEPVVAKHRYAFYDDPIFRAKLSKASSGKRGPLPEATKKKISEANKKYYENPEAIKKSQDAMRLVVQNNPDSYSKNNVVGRVKNIEYRDGIILKGSWELLIAQALDTLAIAWEQPSNGIPYEWEGRIHHYFPDFYLKSYDLFIEVKGYERSRDRAKWQVVDNLCVIKHSEFTKIKENVINLQELVNNSR